MFSSKSIHWWMTTLVMAFVVLLSIFSFIARKPLCIDSKIVEKIDVEFSGQEPEEKSVYRCGYYKRVEFHPELIEIVKEINRRVGAFEKSIEVLGGFKNRLTIRVTSGDQSVISFSNNQIVIPSSSLKRKGQLEKFLLKSWFVENASNELKDRLLYSEVFSDFLFYAIYGDMKIDDLEHGVSIDAELDSRWPQVLSSEKTYCESVWRSPELKESCARTNLASDSKQIYTMSLRPLLTQAMIEAFEFLEPADKLNFLKNVGGYIGRMKYLDKIFGMSVLSKERQSYFDAVFEVENFKYLFSRIKIESPIAKKFAHYFEFEMKKLGFIDAETRSLFDVVIVSESPSQRLLEKIPSLLRARSKKLVAFQTGGYLTVDLKKEPLAMEVVGLVQAHRGILVQCQNPSLEDLRKFSEKFQKIIFVKDCVSESEKSPELNLEDLLIGDIGRFARKNPELKFAEFHLPSLLMAMNRIPRLEIVESLSKKNWQSLADLGFENPIFDDSLKAYRSQSAIAFVSLFRL